MMANMHNLQATELCINDKKMKKQATDLNFC